MNFEGLCNTCGESGQWPTAQARSNWADYHWERTGHDDVFERDLPVEKPKARKPLKSERMNAFVARAARHPCRCPVPPSTPDQSLIAERDCPAHQETE